MQMMMENSFFDSNFSSHVKELRKRCLYVIIFFIIALFGMIFFSGFILALFIKPVGSLYFTSLSDPFLAYLWVSFWGALILTFPFLIYQAWKFVSIGLCEKEKGIVLVTFPAIVILFALGCCFAYCILLPIAIKFLLSFSSNYFLPMLTIRNYIAFAGSFILYVGVSFELPVLMILSVKLKLVNVKFYQKKRRHVFVGVLILCAFFTPPDVVTQILLAGPLLILYEGGVLFSKNIK